MNAIYVLAVDPKVKATVKGKWPQAEGEAATNYLGIVLPDDAYRCEKTELAALSKALQTDVIFLAFQSTVDAFQFHHWNCGRHLRSLVYGCFTQERTWEEAEGTPEDWEGDALFDPEHLSIALRYATNPEERRELEQIYRDEIVLAGNVEPGIDGRECAREVAEYFGFPGWG